MQRLLEGQRINIVADTREFPSGVVKELARLDCIVTPKQLHVGDYICSERVGVERKSSRDFLQSIIDQRLFAQAQSLKDAYPSPIIIIEGDPDSLYTERNIHPNAVNGALASLAVDFRIPILWSLAAEHTASLLFTLAKREQVDDGRVVAIRGEKRVSSLQEQQEFLVAGLPNVSTVLAKRLLEHFKTPKKVFAANEAKLKNVEGIGDKKAKKIIEILETPYSLS